MNDMTGAGAPKQIVPVGNIGDFRGESVATVPDETPVFREPVSYLPVESGVELEMEAAASAAAAAIRERGFRMYLEGCTPQSISELLGVPPIHVQFWARTGGWVERLKRFNDELEKVAKESVRAIRLANAPEEAASSLKLGKRIRAVASRKLETDEKADEISPANLKFLADAAKATGDLGDHGMGTTEGQEGAGSGRQPLVIVFKDGMPPQREKPVIDV